MPRHVCPSTQLTDRVCCREKIQQHKRWNEHIVTVQILDLSCGSSDRREGSHASRSSHAEAENFTPLHFLTMAAFGY